MANSYFDVTGVLMLKKVTPVIEAIYSGYNLDTEYPGNGEFYISLTRHGGDSSWDIVIESLARVADSKGMNVDTTSPADVLICLAKYFGVDKNHQFNQLLNSECFNTEAPIESLYLLADLFNDGHGLCGYATESAWTSSSPGLFEFGGSGHFQGANYTCTSNSSDAINLGKHINQALNDGSLEVASVRIQVEIQKLLDGIVDEDHRKTLKGTILKWLQQN